MDRKNTFNFFGDLDNKAEIYAATIDKMLMVDVVRENSRSAFIRYGNDQPVKKVNKKRVKFRRLTREEASKVIEEAFAHIRKQEQKVVAP